MSWLNDYLSNFMALRDLKMTKICAGGEEQKMNKKFHSQFLFTTFNVTHKVNRNKISNSLQFA